MLEKDFIEDNKMGGFSSFNSEFKKIYETNEMKD